jgi:predicted PurR-regulated permease PerM
MPRIRGFACRPAPRSRRTRVILNGEEIITKVGGYVLGNLLTSVVAGIGSYVWMPASGVPDPVLLAIPAAAALRLLLHEVTFRRLDSA